MRSLSSIEGRRKIDFSDFDEIAGDRNEIGTTITLRRLKNAVRKRFAEFDDLDDAFSASNLRSFMLIAFLQRLVSLRDSLGNFEISFRSKATDGSGELLFLRPDDLPQVSEVVTVHVEDRDLRSGDCIGTTQELKLSHYRLDATRYRLPKNAISLCARSSPALDVTSRYLRTKGEQNNAVEGLHHIVLVESELFDRRINEQRDGFVGIPDEIPSADMFIDETVSFDSIYEKIDSIIYDWVSPTDWRREIVLEDVALKFGVSAEMVSDTETRIRHGDTAKSVAERVIKKYQDRILADTVDIVDLKDEIVSAKPDTDEFRRKIDELTWKFTASLKSFDMAHLSQLIVRRAAIVEVLALACQRELDVQTESCDRRKDERIIHSIFFPMRKDSREVSNHDIWLLSEEYQYYKYIASDKPLSKIYWEDNHAIFDSDIDAEFDRILQRRSDSNRAKRPDIAIFSEEGSAIIVEFKAPGVSLDEHVGDLSEYAHLLAAKSRGRLKKFYGYLIGDQINSLRMTGWTRFPSGSGYFRSSPLNDPDGFRGLGELYEETIFFKDIVGRARRRIESYKDRLQLDFGKA